MANQLIPLYKNRVYGEILNLISMLVNTGSKIAKVKKNSQSVISRQLKFLQSIYFIELDTLCPKQYNELVFKLTGDGRRILNWYNLYIESSNKIDEISKKYSKWHSKQLKDLLNVLN